MIKATGRKANLMVSVIALLLSGMVYVAVVNYPVLQANINPVPSFVEGSDILVHAENGDLSVTLQRTIEDVESVSVLVFYNPDEVVWDNDTVTSPYIVTVAEGEKGEATVIVTMNEGETLEAGSSLLTIGVNGNMYEMTLSDAVITFADQTDENLSIALQ